ncbi:unnamed protein product [Symbiodinium sp. CCMP2592]|nr:unnamed protein product [Symbiodinium sp. CCMP2592]
MVHGDEGRGRNKVATMVIAVQPLVSWLGPEFVNMSGHSMTTRLVFAVVPSTIYAGDATLDTLHGALASDLLQLHKEGLEATSYLESKFVGEGFGLGVIKLRVGLSGLVGMYGCREVGSSLGSWSLALMYIDKIPTRFPRFLLLIITVIPTSDG